MSETNFSVDTHPSPPGETVTGHVVMETSDVERALAEGPALGQRRLFLWPLLIAVWFLISNLSGTQMLTGFQTLAAIAVLVPAIAGFILYARKRSARGVLEGKSERDRTITYEFDGEGYGISTPNSTSRSAWSSVLRYHEGKSSFLLYSNPTVHQIVPKRAFRPEDVAKLRTLIQTHVRRPRDTKRRWLVVLLWICLVLSFIAVWQFVQK